VWLISVPTGRFVAVATLSHRASWGRPMIRFVVAVAMLSHRKHPLRCRVSGQYDVGHEGVITGCDAFSLRSYIANPQRVAQSPRQSTFIQVMHFNKCYLKLLVMNPIKKLLFGSFFYS